MRDILGVLNPTAGAIRVGTLVGLDATGAPRVDVSGDDHGPRSARTIVPLSWTPGAGPVSVVLAFESGDLMQPIVLGVIQERVELELPPAPREFLVAGRRMTFDASESILLRCGRGSIELRADGEIVVRGTRLTQRASGPNVIQGATVRIN